jgi:hypothetical protein
LLVPIREVGAVLPVGFFLWRSFASPYFLPAETYTSAFN